MGVCLPFPEIRRAMGLIVSHIHMCVFMCACNVLQNASYLDREDPDLPVCVEQTVLVWIPLGFLWLCAPWHLVSLCRRTQVNTKHLSKLYLCKQVMYSARKIITLFQSRCDAEEEEQEATFNCSNTSNI